MGKSNTPAPVGEVVLVAKKAEPADKPKIREISQKEYEKLRPKKELSEKQKENLAKLVEKNKQRALERRAVVKEVPDTVPEDKELVIVKPKRKYVRKATGGEVQPKNEVVMPSESEPETATESESEVEVRKPLPLKRAKTPKPKKQTPKKPAKYKYETETTSADDWSDDDHSSDDDYEEKVQKYKAKAHARLQAVQEIDKRMSHIQNNPYASRNLSIF